MVEDEQTGRVEAMRTPEERISELHKRAGQLRRQKDRRQIAGLGGVSAFFAVLLTSALVQADGLPQSVSEGQFTGSSLLSEATGGYILAAVLAFFAGVIITVVIFRYRRK